MSEDLNRTILVGRLTKNAELAYTNSGYPLCKMSIAVNRRKKDGDQWTEEANFFDLTLWGKRGESLNQYLTKGQQVAVEGQLRQDRWERDGQKRSRVVIEVQNIQLIGSKAESKQQNDSFSAKDTSRMDGYKPPTDPVATFEDDIPF